MKKIGFVVKESSEIWKEMNEFNKYEISNMGRIRNKSNKKLLKFCTVHGYYYACLMNNVNNKKTLRVNRLVAKNFICMVEGKNIVHHINGIRTDNRVENLQWVTNRENTNEALAIENMRKAAVKRMADPEKRQRISETMKNIRANNKVEPWKPIAVDVTILSSGKVLEFKSLYEFKKFALNNGHKPTGSTKIGSVWHGFKIERSKKI